MSTESTKDNGTTVLVVDKGLELFKSDATLPANMFCNNGYSAKESLESSGVIFREKSAEDSKFWQVSLPVGWHKAATAADCSNMLLVDGAGHVRATLAYKAAGFSREPNMKVLARFDVKRDSQCKDGHVRVVISDDGTPVSASSGSCDNLVQYHAMVTKLMADAEKWLTDKGYPDYKDPSLYW